MVASAAVAAPSFTVSVLAHGGFNNVTVKAVNSSGVVIGNAKDQDGNPVALMWRPGESPVNLKSLGMDVYDVADISDSGFILGKGSGDFNPKTIRWSQTTGSHELGPTSYNPIAVNNAGMVIGEEVSNWDEAKSYLWSESNGFQSVPHQGLPFTFVRGIDSSGKVLFAGKPQSGRTQSYIWSPGIGTQQITNPFGVGSDPIGINDQGAVTMIIPEAFEPPSSGRLQAD